VCISGEKVGLTPSFEIQMVLVIPVAAAVSSPSSLTEARPRPKKAHTRNSLPDMSEKEQSARY
jgi:hypothetical protein